ncbi:MFS transporter [Modicisalibacter radicis]|uniref:MFS transporter n=1 Tax=Halomonas sp. EAR18 TaxID=2518972 RepID=UPI00109BFC6B|nr:MFS transporter [Halomonas sp. EAR18]
MSYKDVVKQYPGVLALCFIAVFSGNLGQTFVVGFFQPAISETFALTNGQFGMAYSAVTLISGFLIFFIGPTLDWVPARLFAAFIVLAMTLGVLLLTLTSWPITALIGLGLVRFCGQGLFTHLGTTVVAKQVAQARGRALALVTLAMPIGEAILPSAIAGALLVMGWREVWWVMLAALLVVWGPVLTLAKTWPRPSHQRCPKGNRSDADSSPRPLSDMRFWRLSLMMMSIGIVNTGIFVFQADLVGEFDATPSAFAVGFALAATGRVCGALIAGRLVDRLGAAMMARLYLFPLMAGLSIAVGLQNAYGIFAYMLLSGLVTGMQEPTITSLLIQIWGSRNLATLRSVFAAGMVFSSGLAPAVFGLLLDAGIAFTTILLLMAAMVAMGWLLAWKPLQEAARGISRE